MRSIRIWVLLIIVGLISLWPGTTLAGAGGGGGGSCAGFASGDELMMRDSCFEGVAHFVNTGTTLLVRNEGKIPHSFTAVDGSFDSGLLGPGETAEIPLDKAGIVRAYCTLHGTAQGHGMAGVLVIGKPAPEGVGTAGLTDSLRNALSEHDQALRGEAAAQAQSLEGVVAEVVAVRQAIEEANARTRTDLIQANALGILGVVLGGAALALVLRYWRPATRSEDEVPAPPPTSSQRAA